MENEDKQLEQLGYFGFDVAELTKIDLGSGDVLSVTIKSDRLTKPVLEYLQRQLMAIFPDNEILVLGMKPNEDVQYTIVNKPIVSYCNDCSCGKKEQIEGDNNGQPTST